jgi:hypothetical protein
MSARRLTALAAALIAAASLTGGTAMAASASPDTFIGHSEGWGPTLAAAQSAADEQMYSDYYGCKQPFYLVSDGQLANGTWWAKVAANGCIGYY